MRRCFIALAIALSVVAASTAQVRGKGPPAQQKTKATAKGKAKAPVKAVPKVQYDLAAVNNAATTDQLMQDSEGTAVLRAQILLDRADFSVGEIDGRMGTNAV